MQLVTIKCPKCGYLQEESEDCVRCGIIFAKYYALHTPERAIPQEGQDPGPAPYSVPAETLAAEVSELRQNLRDVARRLNDMDFERAERSVLRGETKALEQRLNESLAGLSGRVQTLEGRDPGLELEQLKEELWEKELGPFMDRLDRLEEGLDKLISLVPDDLPGEPAPDPAARLDRLEGRMESIAAALEKVPRDARPAEDLIRELEEMRNAVRTATVRYTEIGELKKNHLVLQNEIDTLRRELDSLRNQPSNGTAAKLGQLDSELAALRAEARQTLKQLEALEGRVTSQAQAAKEAAEGNGLRDALAGLEAKLADQSLTAALRIDALTSDVSLAKGTAHELRLRLQALQESLDAPAPESRLERDVRAIKDGLEQIRDFMQSLALSSGTREDPD
jgi:chromosome segregation ATPase